MNTTNPYVYVALAALNAYEEANRQTGRTSKLLQHVFEEVPFSELGRAAIIVPTHSVRREVAAMIRGRRISHVPMPAVICVPPAGQAFSQDQLPPEHRGQNHSQFYFDHTWTWANTKKALVNS